MFLFFSLKYRLRVISLSFSSLKYRLCLVSVSFSCATGMEIVVMFFRKRFSMSVYAGSWILSYISRINRGGRGVGECMVTSM